MPSFTSDYKAEFMALINELEAKMKEIIVWDVGHDVPVKETDAEIEKLIKEFEKLIPDDYEEKQSMIRAARYSKRLLYSKYKRDTAMAFQKARDEMGDILGVKVATPAELMTLIMNNLDKIDAMRVVDVGETSSIAFTQGTPYIADYYRRLRRSLNNMVDDSIIEPPQYLKKGLTLRSLAEMSIRHQFHQEQVKQYIDKEVKLVWISTHADCSKRCEKWQGRLYSLDGTSGTIEGKGYIPLEKATQIPYTTSKGRTYMNGLFGFNCRHRMLEYTPNSSSPMDYSSKEIAKDREVTSKQRAMERIIYKTKLKANLVAVHDKQTAKILRSEAAKVFAEYKAFSEKNNHAFYPDRCAISQKMTQYIREYSK